MKLKTEQPTAVAVHVQQVPVGPMQNFAYLLAGDDAEGGNGEEGREAILVDPAWDVPGLVDRAAREGLTVKHALLTHGHHDHVNGLPALRTLTGARVWAHEATDQAVDEKLRDGQRVRIAGVDVQVVHTPGHRFDSACYILDGTHVLTGDTLFVGECGRVDLPGSDPVAMHRSLVTVLRALPDDLVVLPGHDYGKTPTSTMGREKAENYTLAERTVGEFLRFMAE